MLVIIINNWHAQLHEEHIFSGLELKMNFIKLKTWFKNENKWTKLTNNSNSLQGNHHQFLCFRPATITWFQPLFPLFSLALSGGMAAPMICLAWISSAPVVLSSFTLSPQTTWTESVAQLLSWTGRLTLPHCSRQLFTEGHGSGKLWIYRRILYWIQTTNLAQ